MIYKKSIVFLLLCYSLQLHAQQWPQVTKEAKPWTRWWWMGSAVDEKGLDQQLTSLHHVGFGGVAVVPIYGAIGYENKYLQYLSPSWMKALDYTTNKARSLQMGVDIAVGTGWPIGGPQVSVQDAATKLIVQQYTIADNVPASLSIVAKDKKGITIPNATLSALMAYDDEGNVKDITAQVGTDGMLSTHFLKGHWELYAAFIGKTGQKVKRAALGGEGFVLDHFSNTSVQNYFKTFDTTFGNSNHGVRSFYDDSYEVFDADWTPDFFNAFLKRRGYNLKPYIKYLVNNTKDDMTARIKSDYRQTLSDLLLENFATYYTHWVHSKKSFNTNESHGSPANILDIYAAVDIPEGEIFGSSHFAIPGIRRDSADIRNVDPDPIMLQFASSAAHVMGKPLVSNETFTWLTDHFKTSWSQCKPEVENTFLAGINHVFYHGTTYSPTEVAWPGWLFYASVNFVPTNSLWPHITGLNEYVTRCQSVLQSGTADNDILAYWPVYDQWNKPEGLDLPFKVHNIDEWLYPTSFYKNVKNLKAVGYSFDFASDSMLSRAFVKNGQLQVAQKGAAYKVLLISQTEFMPLSTLQHIVALVKSGASIIMQELPKQMPGLQGSQPEEIKKWNALLASLQPKKIHEGLNLVSMGKGRIVITQDVTSGLQYLKLQRESLTDNGLQFIRRKIENGKYYYVVNHTANTIDQDIILNTSAKAVYLMNPQTGTTGMATFVALPNATKVRVSLASGEALIIQTDNSYTTNKVKYYPYQSQTLAPIVLKNPWKLSFSNGGPVIPKEKAMDHLQVWTDLKGDSSLYSFSGTGTYETSFNLSDISANDYILSLEKVHESAKVFVNGKETGLIWSIPYQLSIGKYLQKGNNTIQIEVNNLMANRIAYMDRNNIEWRKYHEINFVNIDYKRFDASHWKIQVSGLEGSAIITPVMFKK